MARVSGLDGIRYGFSLLGYIMAISLFGFLFFVVGAVLISQNSPAVGAILVLVGGVVSYVGLAGTFYKVIADAVSKGNENAELATTARKEQQTARKVDSPPSNVGGED